MPLRNFKDVHHALSEYYPSRGVRRSTTLERMTLLMDALGNPQEKVRVVHVAGTSGKTSTCYYIAALLQSTGSKVGLSVSPHVDEINERVQINLQPLPEKQFCSGMSDFLMLIKQVGIEPTYFELLVAFAYWEFARERVDYVVMEVGFGGLIDGTNVVSRQDKVCVIADIGLDHQKALGATVAEIAVHKAGIIQFNNVVFVRKQTGEVMKVCRQRSKDKQADLHIVDRITSTQTRHLPLFQQRNFALALYVVQNILAPKELSDSTIQKASLTHIPARMEIIRYKDKTIILDGAHNAQKLHALHTSIRAQFPDDPLAVLVSFADRHGDRVEMGTKELATLASQLIVTTFGSQEEGSPKSEDIDIMAAVCRTHGIWKLSEEPDPETAFMMLLKCPEPVLLVTGSFFLLNHVRPLIRKL